MTRYFRLLGIHAYLDLLYATRNLRDMVMWVVCDVAAGLAAVSAVYLMAERLGRIGPWHKHQLLFMLGFAIFSQALLDVLFGYNVAWISRRIGRGQLDHTLIQPQPLWLAFATEGFMPFSTGLMLVPGALIMAWAASRLPVQIDAAWLALLAVCLATASLAVMALSFVWGSLAFWAPVAAEEISTNAMQFVSDLRPFPLDGMGRALAGSLLLIIPSGLAAWLPCRYLTGVEPMGPGIVAALAGPATFAVVAALLFRAGMKHYARTGSQRYLSLGHRR